MGVDFGMSRIGLALSDERQLIASPLQTLKAEKKGVDTAAKLAGLLSKVEQNLSCSIQTIVIGMPLMMNGKTGFLADEVKHFVELLSAATPTPIEIWDERLTTVQAERMLRSSEMSRKKRAQVVDVVSAAIILQSYLDCKNIRLQSHS